MTAMGEEDASLLLLDRQIMELNDRISALRVVITGLKNRGGDPVNQFRLLSDMLDVLSAIKCFRIHLKADLNKRR